ncbi:MAG: nucleotidyltransferase family protein [Candidatus Aminicenantes bacterium]|nr:nucleotidyltransferase family protein [Candidatus Aminicenantes bacterium]
MIWAVLLAAGESRRMGEPKLLLPYGEKTILEAVLQNAVASRVDRVLVVLGSRWRRIKNLIREYDVETVINPRFRQGMLTSIQRGIAVLPDACRAAVVVLADQPAIPTEIIDGLIRVYRQKKKGLIVPVYRKKRGHPLLVDLKYRQEISLLEPSFGLRQLLRRHPEDILEVRVSTPSILRDIDDPAAYAKAILKEGRPESISNHRMSFRDRRGG